MREAEAGRCRQWWDEQLEQEGDAKLGWGLLGDAYDRCGEVYAEYAAFYLDNLIEKGRHAEVYKGQLADGQFVAVKRLTETFSVNLN